jgi:hypothetical protein
LTEQSLSVKKNEKLEDHMAVLCCAVLCGAVR